MKDFRNYLLEDKEEPEISEKDQKQAQEFISSLVQAFILDKGEDGSDEDMKKFVKDSLGDVPEKFSSWIEEMCIETKKKIKEHSSKVKEGLDDEDEDMIAEVLSDMVTEGKKDPHRVHENIIKRLFKKMAAKIDGRNYYDPYTNKYFKTAKERDDSRDNYIDYVKYEAEAAQVKSMGSDTHVVNGKEVSQKEYKEWLKKHPRAKEEHSKDTLKIDSIRGKRVFGDTHEVTHDSATTGWYRYMNYGGAKKTAIVLAVAGAAAIGTAVAIHKVKKGNEKMIAGIKAKMENEHDPETRKDYEEFYNNLLKSMYNDSGKMALTPDTSKIPDDDRQYFNSMYKKSVMDKSLKQSGGDYIKDNGSDFLIFDRKHLNKSETKKEEVVKADDGSEIHARSKKTGHGMTYVRMKGGEEIGYATKDEFRKAKQNEGMISLKWALIESFEN